MHRLLQTFLLKQEQKISSKDYSFAPCRNYYSFTEDEYWLNLEPLQFEIYGNLEQDVCINGRLILFIGHSQCTAEPRFEEEDACFAKDIENVNWSTTTPIIISSKEWSLPHSLAFLPEHMSTLEDCYLQVVMHLNINDPDCNSCPGNVYSLPIPLKVCSQQKQHVITLRANQTIPSLPVAPVHGSEWLQCISMKSTILSAFHGYDVDMYAAVILPKDYDADSSEAIPGVYYMEGFTGTEFYRERADDFLTSKMGNKWKSGEWPMPMIRIVLGSRFTFGHTSFADGVVNGPWATALITEFIPYLEKQFNLVQESTGRFLTGHSSGGWSSLWLQIQYPEFFSGCWSSSPDPVDFEYFQLVNIYTAKNMYWDPYGRPYPCSRKDGAITLTMRDENLRERVLGRRNGGQWDSFFAVFGPREEGSHYPIPLFDKVTGEINTEVAEYWKRFDICLYLTENPHVLHTELAGKLHVICGQEDTYYLDEACRSLKRILMENGGCIGGNYVKMVAGDHSTIKTEQFYTDIFEEITATFQAHSC